MIPSDTDTATDPRAFPFPAVVALIVAANVLLFVLQLSKGMSATEPMMADLIRWGANLAPFTLLGEPWRLFTSMFLHIGLLHLAVNMYMLIALGPIVEREFGKLRFALVYLVSGLFGSIASALWNAHHSVTRNALVMGQLIETSSLPLVIAAGASGALMGICGALLGRILVSGSSANDQAAIGMKGPLVQTIAINLVMGFINSGIDNACHIGGLVAGLVLGMMFSKLSFGRDTAKQAGAAIAVSAACIAGIYWVTTLPQSDELVALKADVQRELAGETAVEAPGTAPQ